VWVRYLGTEITAKHPRWIGAWWLGFVICSAINFMLFIPMMMLPKNMKPIKDTSEGNKEVADNIPVEKMTNADKKQVEAEESGAPGALRFKGFRGKGSIAVIISCFYY